MSKNNKKLYGTVETEDKIIFKGFCKNIFNNEKQNIDVYIEDQKIDTIIANNSIIEIEEKYEIYEPKGFCFNFEIPEEYIGEGSKIEFKDRKNHHLLNSPFNAIKKGSKEYIYYNFIKSCKNSMLNEKTINCNEKAIGFIITDGIYEDDRFIEYIYELKNRIPEIEIKAFYFHESEKKQAEKIFKDITLMKIEYFNQLKQEIKVLFIQRAETHNKLKKDEWTLLNEVCYAILDDKDIIIATRTEYNLKDLTLYDFGQELYLRYQKVFESINNLKHIKNYFLLTYQNYFNKNNSNYKIDLNQNAYDFQAFERIKILCDTSLSKELKYLDLKEKRERQK